MLLKVDCLPNTVGKQSSINLIYLGRKWTLNWWWWWWWRIFGTMPKTDIDKKKGEKVKEKKMSTFVICCRDWCGNFFDDHLYQRMFVQSKCHHQGVHVVFIVGRSDDAFRRDVQHQLVRIERIVVVQRVDQQSFSCRRRPRQSCKTN